MSKINQILQQKLKTNENALTSPLSLKLALYMLALIAKEDTKSEILSLLEVEESKLLPSYRELSYFYDDDEVIKSINHIFYDVNSVKQTHVVPENITIESYSRFNKEDIQKLIDIVREETEGKIDDLSINEDDVIHFINILLFKDEWNTEAKIESYKLMAFHNRDNSSVEVPYIKGKMTYISKSDKGEGFTIPYRMGASLYIYMPKDMDNFLNSSNDILSTITSEILSGGTASRGSKFYMPKFKLKTSLKLKDVLSPILPTAFSPSADLSECFSGDIRVGDIQQNLFINVDEHGTEAAAMTDISCMLNSYSIETPEYITVDKPFIYALVDTEENILFAGIQNNFEK